MSTRTRCTRPPSTSRSSVRTPRPVSIVNCFLRAMPWSNRYLATQRTPLPHISPSEPSALNIRIRASARSEGMIRIRPSPPIPKWRSLTGTRQRGRVGRRLAGRRCSHTRNRCRSRASW